MTLIKPEIFAVFRYQTGCNGLQLLLGHVVVEHFWGFDNVVIHTHQYHVFKLHGVLLSFFDNG